MSERSTPTSTQWHIYASTEPGKAILAVNADGTVILHGKEVVQSHEEKEAVKAVFAGFMKDGFAVRAAVEAERNRIINEIGCLSQHNLCEGTAVLLDDVEAAVGQNDTQAGDDDE